MGLSKQTTILTTKSIIEVLALCDIRTRNLFNSCQARYPLDHQRQLIVWTKKTYILNCKTAANNWMKPLMAVIDLLRRKLYISKRNHFINKILFIKVKVNCTQSAQGELMWPALSVVRRPSCVVRQLFYLNISSKTAHCILTKLHRNDPYVFLYQSCSYGSDLVA